jgi:hypothetical protein
VAFGVPAYQGALEKSVRELLTDRTDADGVIERAADPGSAATG